MMKTQVLLKAFLSVWLIYHLANVIVLGNGGSIAARRLEPYLLPYSNTLGINSTWNFFSPDPAHTMYFEYRIRFENEKGDTIKEPIEGFLPPEKRQLVLNSSERRLLYAMRFLIIEPSRLQNIMAPWLCRKYPGASEISIRHYVYSIPNLDKVLASPDVDVDSLRTEYQTESLVYSCRGKSDEVSL
jgi:hypothetical protein